MKKKRYRFNCRTFLWAMVECAIVMGATILLFAVFSTAAYAERGYEAVGGEYTAFLFPLFWIAVKLIIRDIASGLFIVTERKPEYPRERRKGRAA